EARRVHRKQQKEDQKRKEALIEEQAAKPAILGPNKWPAPGARLGPGLGPMRFSTAPAAAPAPVPVRKPAPQAADSDDYSDSSDSDSGVD
ncbi:hypothetical protein ACHAO7_012239, partial [Fusarium culmorum]